ncbi:HalD/BesD family halogenase [Streptomyces gardneri]|uniref:HalD/BesD family halogenase n=1 Tax=Streptomyces gardneri TaxID=66892 RepID=UPI00340F6FDB
MLSLPSPTHQQSLRRWFSADGYVALPGLLSSTGLATLGAEARRLEAEGVRRDFRMPCMADSPRHMTTLGGHRIADASPAITGLYEDRQLRRLLSSLHGEAVVTVHDPVERHVLNVLHRPGDTHGAHTDDYPLALVLFLEAPPSPAGGGLLEFHPDRSDLDALDAPGTRRVHHRPGDGYLLRSDRTAHRVTPLTRPGLRRTVLNFAYTTPGRQGATSSSASLLYD